MMSETDVVRIYNELYVRDEKGIERVLTERCIGVPTYSKVEFSDGTYLISNGLADGSGQKRTSLSFEEAWSLILRLKNCKLTSLQELEPLYEIFPRLVRCNIPGNRGLLTYDNIIRVLSAKTWEDLPRVYMLLQWITDTSGFSVMPGKVIQPKSSQVCMEWTEHGDLKAHPWLDVQGHDDSIMKMLWTCPSLVIHVPRSLESEISRWRCINTDKIKYYD